MFEDFKKNFITTRCDICRMETSLADATKKEDRYICNNCKNTFIKINNYSSKLFNNATFDEIDKSLLYEKSLSSFRNNKKEQNEIDNSTNMPHSSLSNETDINFKANKNFLENSSRKQSNLFGMVSTIIVIIIILLCIIKPFSNSKEKNSSKKPDNVELMTYAQLILEDYLSNPSYSSYKEDYNFIETNLRYKIEGEVTINSNKQKFWIIIEFTDDTYQEYDLISLQIGNNKIY